MAMGGRKTIAEFGQYLGFAQTTISAWMNGTRLPDEASAHKLSLKLGDGIYDALKLPRPEENLTYLQRIWDQLSDKERKAIREQAEKYVAHNKRG